MHDDDGARAGSSQVNRQTASDGDGVAGLVLAAGAGRRFGGPKALVRLGNRTLLERAVDLLVAGGCRRPICVVFGERPDGPIPTIEGMRATWNLAWREGIASSLHRGLAQFDSDADVRAVVVVLVDQPGLEAAAVARVIEAHRAGAVVAVATYAGRRGHPVLLDRGSWPGVRALASGDEGARAFMRAHSELVTEVACDGFGTSEDIDTPADLERLERQLEAQCRSRHPDPKGRRLPSG